MDAHVCVDSPTQKNRIYEGMKLKMCFSSMSRSIWVIVKKCLFGCQIKTEFFAF